MTEPATARQMIERAMSEIGKIDAGGPRGVERVTHDEIEAMAVLLVCFGVPAANPNRKEKT